MEDGNPRKANGNLRFTSSPKISVFHTLFFLFPRKNGKSVGEDAKPGKEDGKPGKEDGKPGKEDGKPGKEDGKPGKEDGKSGKEDGKPGKEDGKPGFTSSPKFFQPYIWHQDSD